MGTLRGDYSYLPCFTTKYTLKTVLFTYLPPGLMGYSTKTVKQCYSTTNVSKRGK